MKSESKLPPETEETFHTFAKEMYESAGLLQGKKHHTCSYLYNLATEGYIKAIILRCANKLIKSIFIRKNFTYI